MKIVLTLMETLLENSEERHYAKNKNMRLSQQTIARRIQDLLKNVNKQFL